MEYGDNNEMKLGKLSAIFILSFVIFQIFFFPSSLNGHIIGGMWAVKNFSAILLIFVLLRYSYLPRDRFVCALILMMWLTALTFTTSIFYSSEVNDLSIAWASLSGFLPSLFIWCMVLPDFRITPKVADRIIYFLSLVVVIWGWGIVFKVPSILNLTESLYSQLSDVMFENMVVIRGKPVMSFGTHSMAAFFILIVFYYNCLAIKAGRSSLLRTILLLALFMLAIPLRSNTALLAMIVMAGLLIWSINNLYLKIGVIFLLVAIALYYYASGVISSFVGEILFGNNAENHGFASRYLGSIFEGNFEIAEKYIGVGFLRSDSRIFRMNDSAIIYLFTQGNIVAVVLSYGIIYSFFKTNMNKYALLSFGIFFIWEFISASTFISVKMVSAHLLTIVLINSMYESNDYLLEKKYIVDS